MPYHRHTYRDDIAGPTWLYKLYSGTELTYVGVSADPRARFSKHRRRPWWSGIDRVVLRWFPSRMQAFAAERAAIATERPAANIARPKGGLA